MDKEEYEFIERHEKNITDYHRIDSDIMKTQHNLDITNINLTKLVDVVDDIIDKQTDIVVRVDTIEKDKLTERSENKVYWRIIMGITVLVLIPLGIYYIQTHFM